MATRYKKGDKASLKNYRPVSTIVEVAKLTEMAAHDQVCDHFLSHCLLHSSHHRSVPHLDTTTTLLDVQRYALDAVEQRKIMGTVLPDHQILIDKLKAYAFNDSAISWFTSYLAERTYWVQIESKRSDQIPTGDYGVPQGSILGSLLFVIS